MHANRMWGFFMTAIVLWILIMVNLDDGQLLKELVDSINFIQNFEENIIGNIAFLTVTHMR